MRAGQSLHAAGGRNACYDSDPAYRDRGGSGCHDRRADGSGVVTTAVSTVSSVTDATKATVSVVLQTATNALPPRA